MLQGIRECLPDVVDTQKVTKSSRGWQGLKMAIKDPLVLLFAIVSTAELLGMSLVQFFPT